MKKRILQFGMMAKAVMIVLLLGMAGMVKGYAQNFTVGDLNYSVNEDEISVTVRGHVNGTSASGELLIPELVTYNGVSYAVTGIRNQAFKGCSGLTGSLVIPNSITQIGEYAFKNCTGFNGTLTIGITVNCIEEEAFANTGFITVNFNPTNCWKMGYYREDGDWYGSPVFKDCPSITTLNIAENVTEIPVCAFRNCSGLDGNLNIPNLVTYIGYGAFYGCSGYNDTLTIGTGVTSISDYAFYGCQFAELHYNATNCTYHYGESPLLFSSNEKTLVIGNTVDKIPDYFFYNSGISGTLTIPNSVTKIGEGAFESCNHLTGELIIPNSVTKIGDGAFHLCSGFTKLTIGTSVSNMGYLAFASCSGITEVDYNAINCANIYPVYSYLGRKPPFEGCDFELVIGEGVTKIPSNMFRDHNYGGILSGSIIIPSSVTTIGDYAFSGNSRVSSITVFNSTPPTVGTDAFSSIDTSIPCYVPYCTMAVYMATSGWSRFTNYQEMPPVNTTQTVELAAGWNWFSTNIEITLKDLQNALVDAAPNTNITIKSNTQNNAYNPGTNQWRGTLDSLDVSQMYMIQVGADCQITLTGTSINPNACPITIHNGNNWIAFPLSESMSISDAFSGFATNGDIIKGRTTTARYNNGNWRGGLDSLEPGQGYIYKTNVTETRTFTFPTSAK